MFKIKSTAAVLLSIFFLFIFNSPILAELEAPEMVYPQDKQVLDLEGAYLFKLKPVTGASGYLFGLFQDGKMIYENYRDTRTLSPNGEFVLSESDPLHANFHSGELKVVVRALVEGQWTGAKTIYLNLRPRGAKTTRLNQGELAKTDKATISGKEISDAATDSSALQKRIDELQKRLEQSQQRQNDLENRLNEILTWIKSVLPFYK